MKNHRSIALAIWACSYGAALGIPGNPTDPGTNNLLEMDGAFANRLAPPAAPEVAISFDKAPDAGPVAKIANFSLRQVAPELGAGTPGGTLEDLDGDGDLDMVLVLKDRIVAYKNTGTAAFPKYDNQQYPLATVSYFGSGGLEIAGFYVNVHFGDINGDGARDMVCGEGEDGQVSCFFRSGGATGWPAESNYGTQKKVLYQSGVTTHLIETSANDGGWFDLAIPNAVPEDIDGDGKMDLVVGDPDDPWFPPPSIIVYRGTGLSESGSPVFAPPAYLKAAGSYIRIDWSMLGAVCPAFHDVDGDGDRDLLASTTTGEIWVFLAGAKDTNPASDNYGLPVYSEGYLLTDNQGQPFELGEISTMSVADFSHDGDKDLIVVSSGATAFEENRLRVLENLSPNSLMFDGKSSAIGVSGHLAELRATYTSKAAFFDFDNDGKVDVLYADKNFGIAIAYNLDTGNDHNPVFSAPVGITLSQAVRDGLGQGVPEVVDFDGDNLLDAEVDGILVGTETGLVFLRSHGQSSDGTPLFHDPVSVLPTGFPACHFIEPTVGDINADGKLDVIIGTGTLYSGESRNLRVLTNSASNGFNLATAVDFQVGGASVQGMFPEIVDIDGDGDKDLLVTDRTASFNSRAIADAAVRLYRKDSGGFTNAGLLQTAGGSNVATSTDASARAVDFNKDGRFDLMLTSRTSSIIAYIDSEVSGLSLQPATPALAVEAVLPDLIVSSNGGRSLTLQFPTAVMIGSIIDANDLFVGGLRCSISGHALTDYHADTDGDGISDGWESWMNDYLGNDPYGDYDGDGRTNSQEAADGTNPFEMDSDGDGIPDGEDSSPNTINYTPVSISGALRVLTPSKP